MTTSVPTVIPLQEFKLKVARLLELSLEFKRQTGDASHFKGAVAEARLLYESQMKEAANMGWLDRKYLNQVGAALERVEAIAARA
jgi:hypothetical protein